MKSLKRISIALLLIFALQSSAQEFISTQVEDKSNLSRGCSSYGFSIDVDGNTMVVNATTSEGLAAVYQRQDDGQWTLGSYLDIGQYQPSNFNVRVALSGNYAAIGNPSDSTDENLENGVPNAGAVLLFEKNDSGTWDLIQKIVRDERLEDDQFGKEIKLDGNNLFVTRPSNSAFDYPGLVYIYQRNAQGIWDYIQTLSGLESERVNSRFGTGMDLHKDHAIIGASQEDYDSEGNKVTAAGAIYTYKLNASNEWTLVNRITHPERKPVDNFGNAVSIHNNKAFIGISFRNFADSSGQMLVRAGQVAVYHLNGSDEWEHLQDISAPDPTDGGNFGGSVSFYDNLAMIGAFGDHFDENGEDSIYFAGSAYIFEADSNGMFSFIKKTTAGANRKMLGYYGLITAAGPGHLITSTPIVSPYSLYFYEREGCSEIISNLSVTHTGIALTANQDNVSYQWVNCNTNEEVSGATDQSYTPSINGDYKVILTEGKCKYESNCVSYNSVGIQETGSLKFALFPNPNSGTFHIKRTENNLCYNVTITNSLGQPIFNAKDICKDDYKINLDNVSNGIYMISLDNGQNKSNQLISIQK